MAKSTRWKFDGWYRWEWSDRNHTHTCRHAHTEDRQPLSSCSCSNCGGYCFVITGARITTNSGILHSLLTNVKRAGKSTIFSVRNNEIELHTIAKHTAHTLFNYICDAKWAIYLHYKYTTCIRVKCIRFWKSQNCQSHISMSFDEDFIQFHNE